MISKDQHLKKSISLATAQMAATRDGYGEAIMELGKIDDQVIVLCADLADSTRNSDFKKQYPKRYVEVGVAEQNLAALGSGYANYGKIPFIASYAAFSPGRNNEQIRTTIALNNVPVKIMGFHAGLSVGPDGATHQALEDIALMRVQPNMTVIVPADKEEARKAVHAAYKHDGPVYVRFARAESPEITTSKSPFEFGKANVMYESKEPQTALFVTGSLLCSALEAAKMLKKEGVEVNVINVHTIKPLDIKTVVEQAKKAGAVVSIEEHQINGGFGSLLAETLSQHEPVPQEFIGVHDRFGQSGTTEELYNEYGLTVADICEATRKVIKRKKI